MKHLRMYANGPALVQIGKAASGPPEKIFADFQKVSTLYAVKVYDSAKDYK